MDCKWALASSHQPRQPQEENQSEKKERERISLSLRLWSQALTSCLLWKSQMAFSPSRGYLIYTENLLFSVTTFMNDLSWIFWLSCCSFYISTCCFTLHFYVMEMASFLKPHGPTSASFKLFFRSFLISLTIQSVKAFLWIRVLLRECCGCFHLLSRPLRLSPLAGCLGQCFWFTSGNFAQLTIWCKKSSFSISAFNVPSSLSLVHF